MKIEKKKYSVNRQGRKRANIKDIKGINSFKKKRYLFLFKTGA